MAAVEVAVRTEPMVGSVAAHVVAKGAVDVAMATAGPIVVAVGNVAPNAASHSTEE